jgi:glutaredoxin 3
MKFKVYSKENCPYCNKIKMALKLCGQVYDEKILNMDFTREEFYAKFGLGSSFPQVTVDKKNIGGCKQTIAFLHENGMVK